MITVDQPGRSRSEAGADMPSTFVVIHQYALRQSLSERRDVSLVKDHETIVIGRDTDKLCHPRTRGRCGR